MFQFLIRLNSVNLEVLNGMITLDLSNKVLFILFFLR